MRILALLLAIPACSLGQTSRPPSQAPSFLYCPPGGGSCIQVPYTSVPSSGGGSGAQGPQGLTGDPGHTPFPYSGAGVPLDTLGVDTDTYVRTTNGDYYIKAGGTWGSPRLRIKGADGAPGAPGAAGTNGLNGSVGPTGPTGPAGAGASVATSSVAGIVKPSTADFTVDGAGVLAIAPTAKVTLNSATPTDGQVLTWSASSGSYGPVTPAGSSGVPVSFTAATSATLTAVSQNVVLACYSISGSTVTNFLPNSYSINTSTLVMTINFLSAQTGYCVAK